MTQERKKPKIGNFRELKSKTCTGEACSQTPPPPSPLAWAVGARLGIPLVFILDPQSELAQVLQEKWGHLMPCRHLSKVRNCVGWKRQEACRIMNPSRSPHR